MQRFSGEKVSYLLAVLIGLVFLKESAADPTRYPQFAQQLPKVAPEFIYLDQLRGEMAKGNMPLIVDVRTREEYQEAHIKASISIPLGEMQRRLAEIPKDKPVVLY